MTNLFKEFGMNILLKKIASYVKSWTSPAIMYDFSKKSLWLYGDDKFLNYVKVLFSDASICMVLYRLTFVLNQYFITKPLAFIIYKLTFIFCGAVIGRGAKFGRGFVILHGSGVVINSRVVGGENIYIESGVVIGETKKGCPVLGNNIFVGSGAKIIGDISIGDNVTIGANAVVVKSVPDNVVIGGVPAKIIRKKESNESFLVG